MQTLLFYFFSAVAILSALCVITHSKPTRALLSLIVTMFALSVIYLLLGAAFVAMVHLIVYAGAVLVLFLFVIMLQGIGAVEIPLKNRFLPSHLFLFLVTAIGFTAVLICGFLKLKFPAAATGQGSIESVGLLLFQDYLIPFELTSVLLLIGIFAAVSLAKKDPA